MATEFWGLTKTTCSLGFPSAVRWSARVARHINCRRHIKIQEPGDRLWNLWYPLWSRLLDTHTCDMAPTFWLLLEGAIYAIYAISTISAPSAESCRKSSLNGRQHCEHNAGIIIFLSLQWSACQRPHNGFASSKSRSTESVELVAICLGHYSQ